MCFFFFFKQKTAYEMLRSLVGSEMCIRDRYQRRVRGTVDESMSHRTASRESHQLVRNPFQQVELEALPHPQRIQAQYSWEGIREEKRAFARHVQRTQENRDRVMAANEKYYRGRPLPEWKLAPRYSAARYEESPVNESSHLMRKYFESPNPAFGMCEGVRPDGKLVGQVALEHERVLELSRRRIAAYYQNS
eukprot:TRINITY_DN54973_c0_g1_i1.p1 TRINITY_DN54973_c0_g1~~TRINITY_DN54973_c0_g1_i1.p1  ORF type:complete len:192 (+),score=48.97 TRINITY_DN54973_c0_g1_i1:86-661(+)